MSKKFPAFIASLMFSLLMPMQMWAVPAKPVAKRIKVGDIEYATTLRGDEFCHYWQAETGEKIIRRTDGNYHILSYFETENMFHRASQARNATNAARAKKQHGFLTSLTGTKKGLVILVNFKDNAFSIPDPKNTYNAIFNQLDYTGYGMTGSVRDYFRAQSYGLFDMTLDVAGPYTLSKNMSAYGGNDANGNDKGVQDFAREAFKLADADVDYSKYDWNGDGVVEQVFIVYAGYAEAQGGAANTIWPHAWGIEEPLLMDGVYTYQYACSSELRGADGKEIDGIGTVCHEFSHCLGLMDHYDTQGNNFGTGFWDVMASGSYNNNSCTPAGYTSFERWSMGWLEPQELTSKTDVAGMKPLTESPEAYILYNDANPDEFYLLENRQQTGFDAGLYGHGLLVLHVDYDENVWANNMVNVSAARQRMTIIPADGTKENTLSSLQADPFPGRLGVTALTDNTSPAATLYNANADGRKLMGKPIEDIAEDQNGLISFKAIYPQLATPQPACTPLQPGAFRIEWPAVPHAEKYELRLTEYAGKASPQEALLIEEDFEGAYKSSNGFTDIGPKLSNYLTTKGFSGTSLFQSPYKLRFGTSSTKGTMKSPTMDILSTARFTLVLKVKPYADNTKVDGVVNVVTERSNAMNIPFEFYEECYLLLYPTDNIETLFLFNIMPNSRMYLSYLALYDGEFTAEELRLDNTARTKTSKHPVSTHYTTEPHYTFQGLDPTGRYEVIVRATEETRHSAWSGVCTVDFSSTGITTPHWESDKQDFFYDLNGRRLKDMNGRGVFIHNGKKVMR